MSRIEFTKGQGTGNDFVLVLDADGSLDISPSQVAKICDRHFGIGADGLIRVVPSHLIPEGKSSLEEEPSAYWFMDYRNSDGSLAEMCGNGIRVMAKYLVVHGHQGEGIFAINTRDGIKHLRVPAEGDISVNMGKVQDESEEITASQNGHIWNGFNISIGNPHAVVFVEDLNLVGELTDAPIVRPKESYPEGVNVEFVEFISDSELKMRVFERGSGETQSCGTGTCAVALAATLKKNKSLPAKWVIYPPGGRLEVDIDAHSNATLIGPAELVREVDLAKFF